MRATMNRSKEDVSMKWLIILVAVLAFAMGDDARAQQRDTTPATPQFSAADRAVIARNELLARIVDSDPALVRRALDLLDKLDEMPTRGPLEPSDNPDLDRLSQAPPGALNASPEAVNDLFQLLKKAGRPSR